MVVLKMIRVTSFYLHHLQYVMKQMIWYQCQNTDMSDNAEVKYIFDMWTQSPSVKMKQSEIVPSYNWTQIQKIFTNYKNNIRTSHPLKWIRNHVFLWTFWSLNFSSDSGDALWPQPTIINLVFSSLHNRWLFGHLCSFPSEEQRTNIQNSRNKYIVFNTLHSRTTHDMKIQVISFNTAQHLQWFRPNL